MTTLTCSKCGKPLELVPRGRITETLLDQWIGNFCPSCKSVYCFDCQRSFSSLIHCPNCDGITLPAARPMLKEYGVIA